MGRPDRRRVVARLLAATSLWVGALSLAVTPAHGDPLVTCPDTPVLHQVCSVATAAPNLAADGVEAAAEGIFDQATEWVVAGATSVVGYIGETIDGGTRPDPDASWFEPNYRLMVSVGVAFLLPLLIVAALSSLLRQDAAGVVRIVTVKVPVAAMGMVLATWVVDMLVAITDNLSAFVGSTIGGSGERFATGIVHLMEAGLLTGNGVVSGFLGFLVALVIALFALLLWIELVVRQAAVLAATLFLPLGFAGLVWESTSHWLRKLAEGLLAFILAKFVITAIVAVGANAIAAGSDHPAALILGAGILAVAVCTPYVLLSIIPLGTMAVAEGLSRRPLQAGSSAMSSLYWGQALLGSGGGAAVQPAPAEGSAGGGIPPPPGGPVGGGPVGGGAATAPLAVAGGAAEAASGAAHGAAELAQTASTPPVAPTAPGGGDGR